MQHAPRTLKLEQRPAATGGIRAGFPAPNRSDTARRPLRVAGPQPGLTSRPRRCCSLLSSNSFLRSDRALYSRLGICQEREDASDGQKLASLCGERVGGPGTSQTERKRARATWPRVANWRQAPSDLASPVLQTPPTDKVRHVCELWSRTFAVASLIQSTRLMAQNSSR